MSFEHYSMFSIPLFKLRVDPWEQKKSLILDLIDGANYTTDHGPYHTDYDYRQMEMTEEDDRYNSYSYPIWDILFDDVNNLFSNLGINLNKSNVPNMWSQKYYRCSHHPTHNHGHTGYSCVLYLKFNPEVHKPTRFYSPFNNFFTGSMLWHDPDVREGDMIVFPACIAHESQTQETDEERMILSFNIA